ncbi:MAG: AmmeMemoRadiSam system protein A [Planctomycetota bacterium]
MLDDVARSDLLTLARASIAHAFAHSRRPRAGELLASSSPALDQHMGAFVTLTIAGRLRGCIGEIVARRPVSEAVADRACAAAFDDPRFAPLQPGELVRLRIEISALHPPERVDQVDAIEPGRHGVVLHHGPAGAVFLPQVAPEQGWTREQMLSHLSAKAGLPSDAWRHPRTWFEVFEAEVFGEEPRPAPRAAGDPDCTA